MRINYTNKIPPPEDGVLPLKKGDLNPPFLKEACPPSLRSGVSRRVAPHNSGGAGGFENCFFYGLVGFLRYDLIPESSAISVFSTILTINQADNIMTKPQMTFQNIPFALLTLS